MAHLISKQEFLKEVIPIVDTTKLPIKINITDASQLGEFEKLKLGADSGLVVQEIYMNSPVSVINILVKSNSFSEYIQKRIKKE